MIFVLSCELQGVKIGSEQIEYLVHFIGFPGHRRKCKPGG